MLQRWGLSTISVVAAVNRENVMKMAGFGREQDCRKLAGAVMGRYQAFGRADGQMIR
jgi:hypothetical protein